MSNGANLPRARRSQRGAILILVLVSIAAVAVLASMLMREVAVDYSSSASITATAACSEALDAGMLLATDVLMRDKRLQDGVDNLHDEWNFFQLTAESMGNQWDSVDLTGSIEDENRRFPINAMLSSDDKQEEQYRLIFVRLLRGLCEAYELGGDPAILADNLKHWVTSPEEGSVEEDAWYEDQDPPYARTGEAFQYPEEILLVRWPGVEPEDFKRFFYGTEDLPGLRDFITIWGTGFINVNTAPVPMLRAICPSDARADAFVSSALAYRGNSANPLATAWHTKIALAAGLDMTLYPDSCLGMTSSIYTIRLKASRGTAVRQYMAVVSVTDSKCTVLLQHSY